jgi:hypothetical protein
VGLEAAGRAVPTIIVIAGLDPAIPADTGVRADDPDQAGDHPGLI